MQEKLFELNEIENKHNIKIIAKAVAKEKFMALNVYIISECIYSIYSMYIESVYMYIYICMYTYVYIYIYIYISLDSF